MCYEAFDQRRAEVIALPVPALKITRQHVAVVSTAALITGTHSPQFPELEELHIVICVLATKRPLVTWTFRTRLYVLNAKKVVRSVAFVCAVVLK